MSPRTPSAPPACLATGIPPFFQKMGSVERVAKYLEEAQALTSAKPPNPAKVGLTQPSGPGRMLGVGQGSLDDGDQGGASVGSTDSFPQVKSATSKLATWLRCERARPPLPCPIGRAWLNLLVRKQETPG